MYIKSDLPGKDMNVFLFEPEEIRVVVQRVISNDTPQHQKSAHAKQQVDRKSFEYGKYYSQKKRFRRWFLNDVENMPIYQNTHLHLVTIANRSNFYRVYFKTAIAYDQDPF
jgi:hypothetical protein